MKLSNDKCVILYDLQGREAHKFLSKRKHKRNKIPHFKFQQMGEDLWVPIKKYHEYLGTIIAYRDAPARTCAHRMKKARGQYSQLRKTVNSARIVSNRPRYQVPVFTSQENADVNWKVYDITMAIIHLGPNQNSGHYRVAAFTPDHTNCWYSNDNQVAERLSVIPEEIKEQSYILGCLAR